MKVCVICFDFKESNIRLQPWRYIYEISSGMASREIDVDIITDGYPILPKEEKMNGITIHRLKRLSSHPFVKNEELIRLIDKISPDIILWTMGPTSYYFLASIKRLNTPVICLWMGTTYSLMSIMRLGYSEMIRNFHSIYRHAIDSIIPPNIVRSILSNSNIVKVIVLNENNKKDLQNCDIPSNKISVVPPGITEFDLKSPNDGDILNLRNSMKLEKNNFIVLYIGSPLSLRGVDTLINGVSIVSKDIPSLKLIILSRQRKNELIKEERYVEQLCLNKNIQDRTKVISAFLSRKDLKNFIGISDVVVLPFKLVQSDTPISILEVMALGKPIISTKLDGIPELLDGGKGIVINPNNSQELAGALSSLYLNSQMRKDIGERAKAYMLKHPTWEETTENIVNIIDEIID